VICLPSRYHYSEAELREMTWAQLTHPDDLAADNEQFNRVLIGEIDGYELDKRFLTRSGEIVFAKLVVRCVRKPDRSVDFIVAMVQDITKSKQIENELRDAEWKFRALFDNGPIGVAYHSMIYDESGNNDRSTQVNAGRAYARVQLTATAHGLALHPLQQALQEYPEQQENHNKIHKLIDANNLKQTVQMWTRAGYGPTAGASPRRGLNAHLI